MDNHAIDYIFDTIRSSGISIHLGKLDEAFKALETLRNPAGGDWPHDVARGTEALIRARSLVEQAEGLEQCGDQEGAAALWSEVSAALDAARISYRVRATFPLAYGATSSDDSWPDLLRFFTEYVNGRKALYRRGRP